ncbi:unnamed protein product [Thelazia callipaeda]|uniref:YbjN domain-containing protein n=1 Tax=Thelazia callipaeda TaxID=103827 RepID=A0A0N5CLL4_THECL|nr:unnamed protein product [Thelazia callipaeda]
MKRISRRGIVHSVNSSGIARIIFSEENMKIQGTLTGDNGEVFTFRGCIDSSQKRESSFSFTTAFEFLDNETGREFREILFSNFRADMEIYKHITPRIVDQNKEVFIGEMKISTNIFERSVVLERRLSSVEDEIIEISNDFLA